jgi:maltose alpha-D-glucosyltransferase/alpha-amylase
MRDAEPTLPQKSLIELTEAECPQLASETIGPYLGNARLLGERTAEMHLALAGAPDDPDFAPEAFSALTQRALYQSLRTLARRVMQIVRRRAAESPELAAIAERENEILDTFRRVLDPKLDEARIRCHGDYHLGQVLWTGKDWVIIDFEGEPLRPISERRLKKSPLRDVAGMIRSFHYAAHTVLAAEIADHPEQAAVAEKWAQFWYLWVSATFLGAYLKVAGQADFVPENRDDFEVVLDVMLLEKALYELRYEANNRPEWIRIPALGITQLLDQRH